MKKVIFATCITITTIVAQASSSQDFESSAIVNGTIILAQDGTVRNSVIDDEASYGKPITDMVRKAALQWRFHPIMRNGEPVLAKSSMHVRVVLTKTPDGNYSARIKGATFGEDHIITDTLRNAAGNEKIPPHYPQAAVHDRAQGTVYLALHVDRTGHVVEAVAEQVNLDSSTPDSGLQHYRQILADAALKAARKWSFLMPTTGELANQDSWTAHVPVNFSLNAESLRRNAVWQSYRPGPFTPAPWVDRPDKESTDAIADGAVQTDGAGPTLLTPIHHG